jgi:hypothetical protein
MPYTRSNTAFARPDFHTPAPSEALLPSPGGSVRRLGFSGDSFTLTFPHPEAQVCVAATVMHRIV